MTETLTATKPATSTEVDPLLAGVQLTTESCFEHLKEVIDPEIYQNIVDIGLVYGVDVREENLVDVTMTLTTPHCPMGPEIIQDVENTLIRHGASAVNVNIVWEPMWTPDAMTLELKKELGIVEEEAPPMAAEPLPTFEPPPLPPKKKGLFRRLLGFWN